MLQVHQHELRHYYVYNHGTSDTSRRTYRREATEAKLVRKKSKKSVHVWRHVYIVPRRVWTVIAVLVAVYY
jgi:hypothetical protein